MDTWTLIDNRISALDDLYKRMDKTKDYLYWNDEPYQLTNFEGEKLDKVVSITPNQPAVFMSAIIADLMEGKWQTVVEGKLTTKQPHIIEDFIESNLAQADEFLLKKFGMPSLNSWLCNHVCTRSLIGVRWLAEVKDGEYKIDCLPVDMRWTPFEFERWVAARTFRSKAELEAEYEKIIKEKGITISGTKDIEVRDYWNDEKHEIWIDKKLIITEDNPFGYPPFVIAIPPSGFMLRDKGYFKHEGEDLIFLNKGLFNELARSLSIEQTLGMDIIAPPLQYESKGPDGKPPRKASKSGETMKVPEGELMKLVPRGDMNRASMTARADIQKMIQEGGPVLPRAYTSPPSALEVTTEAELLAKLYNPRKKALGVFREGLAKMIIDQYIKVTKEETGLSIGMKGRRTQYSLEQLGDPDTYTISCQLMTKSKRQEIANLAMFLAAYGRLPLKMNLTDILLADDPDGIERELELEKAKEADPAIALHEMALRCIEEAQEIEDDDEADAKLIQAKMLTERGVSIIKQRQQPVQPEEAREPKVEQPKPSGQLPPLLGGGGGGRGREVEEEE